jgi:hypothetical protein
MWSVALAAPLFFSSPGDLVPAPASELELVSTVGTSHLTLVNPTAWPALVLLGSDGRPLESVVVPSRGDRSFEFPRHTLAGTTLALVTVDPDGRPRRSGSYAVDDLISAGYRTVWFESTADLGQASVHAWGELAGGVEHVAPLEATGTVTVPPPAPGPNVPVITPKKRPKGELPPRVDPLPPPPG